MNNASRLTTLGVLASVAVSALSPAVVLASSQGHKNNWRNLGILGGAAAIYGLHTHNTTTTLLGAGAAAYGASRYEQERKSQDARARYRRAHYYRHHYVTHPYYHHVYHHTVRHYTYKHR